MKKSNQKYWVGVILALAIMGLIIAGITYYQSYTRQINVSQKLAMSGAQQVLAVSGVLQSGKQQSEELPVGDISSVLITVISDRPDLLTEIEDPQGKLVASARTSDSYMAIEGAYSADLKMTAPADGIWLIVLSAKSETQYSIVVTAETATVLDVRTDSPRYPTGSYINVNAKLFRERTLLSGGTARGELLLGSNIIQTIDLSGSDDGVFQGQFSPVSEVMRPNILVTARNGTIQRQVELQLVIFEPSARILRVQSEQLLDSDNDGKAGQLVITVQLDIRDAHSYSLAAHLESQKGETITYAEYNTAIQAALGQGSETLSPGQVTIPLSFSGQDIQERGINGPYSVRLVLYDIGQAGAEVNALEYVTHSYSINEFK